MNTVVGVCCQNCNHSFACSIVGRQFHYPTLRKKIPAWNFSVLCVCLACDRTGIASRALFDFFYVFWFRFGRIGTNRFHYPPPPPVQWRSKKNLRIVTTKNESTETCDANAYRTVSPEWSPSQVGTQKTVPYATGAATKNSQLYVSWVTLKLLPEVRLRHLWFHFIIQNYNQKVSLRGVICFIKSDALLQDCS
jgi:hypothetical protein